MGVSMNYGTIRINNYSLRRNVIATVWVTDHAHEEGYFRLRKPATEKLVKI